jgi:hypothetical protein
MAQAKTKVFITKNVSQSINEEELNSMISFHYDFNRFTTIFTAINHTQKVLIMTKSPLYIEVSFLE